MKVYQIWYKHDDDDYECVVKSFKTEDIARKKAQKMANENYINKLKERMKDLKYRIKRAKKGLHLSYSAIDGDLGWCEVNKRIFKPDEEWDEYNIADGDYFIVEVEL